MTDQAFNVPAAWPGDDGADAPTLSVSECEQFIRFWIDVTDTRHVTLVAIHPDSQVVHAKTFTKETVEDARNWIADHQRTGRNVYFQPNETPPDCVRKPRKADMVAVTCRFADVDPDDEHHQLVDERNRLRRLAEHLTRDPIIAPTAIIDSGNGMQPLWAATRDPLDNRVLSRVEAETRAIEAALGAGGTHNIDRLLRLPGTMNFPNTAKRSRGRGVSRARLIFSAPNRYQPEEVATLAAHLTAQLAGTGLTRQKPARATATATAEDADVAALIHDLEKAGADEVKQPDHLPAELRSKLSTAIDFRPHLANRWAGEADDLAKAGRDTSRSGLDLSLAAMLKAAGFSHLDTALILCAFPHGKANGEEWRNSRLRLRHVARTVLRSYEPSSAGVGAGTIFFHAEAAGWIDPRIPKLLRGAVPPCGAGHAGTQDQATTPFFDPWAELQPPPFPIDALPLVLREFAEDRARIIGADHCAIAWAAISAASAALHGNIQLKMKRYDRWSVPPAIWVALVGRPSTKKTPIIAAAWEPLHRAQKADLDDWRRELAVWKATPKDERDPVEPKPRRRLVSHDATMEALQDILGRQDRGVGVLRDELSGWIGSLEKYGGQRSSAADRAFFLQAFDGGPNVIDRVGRGTIAVDNLLVTICGGIQPDRLRQFSDLTDDGLWQRFAPIIVAPATRGLDEPAGPAVEEYADAIDRILTVRGETRVELCNAAYELRQDIEGRIFELERNEMLGARFASFCGKLVGLWGRLCLVLNYLDPSPIAHFIVPLKTAERAATLLFQSVIPCAARVYAATGGAGADVEATRSVAGYILTKHKQRVLASDLVHNIRACRGQPLDHVQRVVSPLVAGGWLIPEKDWNPSSWAVAPSVHEYFQARAATERARRAAIRDVIIGSLRHVSEEE